MVRRLTTCLAAASAIVAAGCASTRLDAQWLDAQAPPLELRGSKVLVACEAYDVTVRQLCQDQLAAEVTARGATPVVAPEMSGIPPGQPVPAERYLASARASGARGVIASTVTLADRQVGSGMSIGLGGFGIGTGAVRAGVGVSVPIGGGEVSSAYAAETRISDTATGRMRWSGKATAPASRDVAEQMSSLARTLLDAADKAGVF
jgi:hypothetical protein